MESMLLRRVARVLLACAILVSGLVGVPAPAAAATYPSFTFTGSGWGHGVGLSQWGAKGFAERGRSGRWIATYYFPGTSIGTAPHKTVRVNIDKAANYATTSSGYNAGFTRSSWRVRPGYTTGSLEVRTGTTLRHTLTEAAGPYTFSGVSGSVRITNGSGNVLGTYSGTVTVIPTGGSTPRLTQVLGASGPFDHSDVRFRGSMLFTASGSSVKAVNQLTTQEYLYGVVPRESPSSWHIEALKAQAIVARSYAQLSNGELYTTTQSQVYNGHSRGNRTSPTPHEASSTNSAVDATNGQFVTYNGTVIRTYFHSSSGGHTVNVEDYWLGSTPQPYYKGVVDPYAESPNDPWPAPVVFNGLEMASRLSQIAGAPAGAGSSVWVKSLGIERVSPSAHVKRVDVFWSNGAVSRGIAGDTVRSRLGLRSTRFFVNSPYKRIALGDRYETSARVSQTGYTTSGSAKVAVVVGGRDERFPDALTASSLAGIAQGPVLLVPGDYMTAAVREELRRLKALGCSKVYIVGGPVAVEPAVEESIRSIIPNVVRMQGSSKYGYDRYGTAASVAMEMKRLGADTNQVLVASGERWPDAAVASAVAAGTKRPIVLASHESLPAGSESALRDLGSKQSVFFGGPVSISDAAVKQVLSITGESAPLRRFGERGNRYSMAVQAASWAVTSLGFTQDNVYIATGEAFPDSVTGGVLAGGNRNPLLLTPRSAPDPSVASYLSTHRTAIKDIIVIGGPNAVTDVCASTLASYAY